MLCSAHACMISTPTHLTILDFNKCNWPMGVLDDSMGCECKPRCPDMRLIKQLVMMEVQSYILHIHEN